MVGCVALVVGAGRGRRFGGDIPKQYRSLGGVPLLRHTLAAFVDHPAVDSVRAVIHPDDRDLYDDAGQGLDLLDPVPGGATRQDSVRLGLVSLAERAPGQVLIHDAARPFPSADLIGRVIDALGETPGAVPAVPVADTLKRGTADRRIAGTVDRHGLWRAQTPQGFHFQTILEAHAAARGRDDLTDDAAVAELAGVSVALVTGSEENFKVTTRDDLDKAARALGGGGPEFRTGTGFDVHRLIDGNRIVLCGIEIPHDRGLDGHSDADVALHAVTDALLGAIAAGDIGSHFPPTDPRWKGAPSDVFLRHAVDLVARRGGAVTHVDLTLICERPKIGPHRTSMRDHLAGLLGIAADRVSVKATTTEKLGFTGRDEGIAAQAAATVRLSG